MVGGAIGAALADAIADAGRARSGAQGGARTERPDQGARCLTRRRMPAEVAPEGARPQAGTRRPAGGVPDTERHVAKSGGSTCTEWSDERARERRRREHSAATQNDA